jgi:hypothetical protein
MEASSRAKKQLALPFHLKPALEGVKPLHQMKPTSSLTDHEGQQP